MNELNDLPEDIRAVVFDFDGTLAETNIDFGKMRRRIIGLLKEWELWEDGIGEHRYVLDLIAAGRQKLAPDEERIEQFQSEADAILQEVELETCKDAAPYPGVAEALGRLRDAGLKVGIVTRNCRVGVASVTSRHHLHHDVLSTRDDVVNVKPHPDHLWCALDLLGVPPEKAVMIGDHITDVQGAEGTGAYTIGVLTNHTTEEEFAEVGADAVFADVPAAVEAIIRAGDLQ
ncbi:MAG: HAD family hydrolase [Armatimonadota bacterium]